MARLSREMKAQGLDIISLSLGEPDFNTPDFIKEAAKKAIDDNYSHYPPVNGYLELRQAISAKFKRDNGLEYSADQIVVSTGAKQSIANVVLSLVNEGDEVLLPAPYWVSYFEIAKLGGGKPVAVPTSIDNDFKVTPDQLEKAISPNTRLMIFSSPCNPSGSVYTAEELAELAEVIARHPNMMVIADEIYELINFESRQASLASNSQIYDQVITINGVSKGFAMTGWRIGYIGAPMWVAKACSKMQGQFTSAPSGISQKAAQAAVESDPADMVYMRDEFLNRRNLMIDLLGEIPGIRCNRPPGAFYLFPDISSFFGKQTDGYVINDANDLSMYLLKEAHVGVVTGQAFGNPECIRLSYAASQEQLKEAAARIKKHLTRLH